MNRKKITVLFILFISLLIIGLTWWNHGLAPVNASDKSGRIFVVKKGDTIRDIASNLKKENFIRDPVVFFLLVKRLGLDQRVQAGDFRLSSSMTAEQIAEQLKHGVLDIWVTIPEGIRTDEIADILQDKLPQYQSSWRVALEKQEGYLFPDTYLIPKDADINLIIKTLRNNFENKYASTLGQKQLNKIKIVTIASLIEREARFDEDRQLVSSVIINRLSLGMPLQIDATIQYALGYQKAEKNWWKKELSFDDLKIDSPYNTYKLTGLPPTPISNPGVHTLQAAANPPNTEYLYYITDKKGHNHYAKTLAEHEANKRKYGI